MTAAPIAGRAVEEQANTQRAGAAALPILRQQPVDVEARPQVGTLVANIIGGHGGDGPHLGGGGQAQGQQPEGEEFLYTQCRKGAGQEGWPNCWRSSAVVSREIRLASQPAERPRGQPTAPRGLVFTSLLPVASSYTGNRASHFHAYEPYFFDYMDFSIAWQKIVQMGRDFMALLPNLLIGIVVFVGFIFVARGVQSLVERLVQNRGQSQSLKLLLSRLSYVAALILGILVTVTIMVPGFTPASLLSALGVGGVAIGFAFKDIFQNFLAGILLLITEPFKIND